MWSSRLFWKLFITYAALNLAATVIFVMIVSHWQQDQVVQQLKSRLHDSTVLIQWNAEDLIEAEETETLQSTIRTLGDEIATRITVVAMSGRVLADSSKTSVEEVSAMESHKDRVELVQAATNGVGSSERASPTLGVPMLYVAIRADGDEGPLAMIRTALPMTEVREEVHAIERLISLVGLLVSVAVVALSYFVAARVVRPVVTLTEAAEAIATGDYQNRVYFDSRDELGLLARSFNRMSDKLDSREAQLRESTQRLKTVLEGMAEGVVSLDERLRIVLANAAAGRLLGFESDQVQGRQLLEVVRNHNLNDALVESQESPESRRIEIEMGVGDNRVISIYLTALSGERKTRFILVLQDVTEIRRLESMRQEFVANVSHELKTPLSSIKAYAETLSQGAIHDSKNNLLFVHRIEDQAERLHQLILDLLSIARIESGQQAFEIAAVDLEQIVLACFAENQAGAESKGVQLITECEAPDAQVRADEEGVRQILNNLVHNAINYTGENGSVTVRWLVDGDFVVIVVADTGLGIAQEHLPRLFERFYRVDKARSRELGGTGLGLSIVKHLTQSFGGSVEVESHLGEGTQFTVRLPHA